MSFKRMLALATGAAAVLAGGALPSAQATIAAPQDNVVHVANVPGSTGGHVVAEGNRLYVGAYGLGMRIFDISNPRMPTEIGKYIPGPQGTGDPGVRADAVPDAAVFNNRHIVTLNGTNRAASSQQTEFLDVTNAAAPILLHRFTGAEGEAHNGDIVDKRRLWLPSGSGGVQALRIYDMNPLLESPPKAPVKIMQADLKALWTASPYRGSRPVGPTTAHVHDLEVYPDYNLLLHQSQWVDTNNDGIKDPTYGNRDIVLFAASQGYPITVGASTSAPSSAVYVVDITDPRAPVAINMIQGRPGHRYMHEAQFLQGNPRVLFTADEDLHNGCDAGGVYSWTLSEDLSTATFGDVWYNGGPKADPAAPSAGTVAPVCSAHVFSSNGPYVFMGSYNAGLQVIDMTNPSDLKRGGQYIAEGANSWGALYNKGYVYVGDFGGRGLDVFEFAPNPAGKGLLKAGHPATRMESGVSERLAACDSASPLNGLDALMVPIPQSKRDGTARIRAITNADPGTEIDIWFYDATCALMTDVGHLEADNGAVEEGLVAENAAFAAVTLYAGAANNVYARFV